MTSWSAGEQKRFTFRQIRVAAVQAEPIFLDIDGTTEKAVRLIERAGAEQADLIGFPEAFIPTFPNWYQTLAESAKSRSLDRELFKNSVEVPGEHIEAVAEACKRASVNAVVGINERLPDTTGTMWNTQVHITRDGTIVSKHQKYVPTVGERQVHTPGGTGFLNSFKTDFGAVSALICGENSNPLGQYAAAVNYPVVHVASWPFYFAQHVPMDDPTYITMRHGIATSTGGLAYALKTFVISAVSRLPERYIEEVADTDAQREQLIRLRQLKTGALILGPVGKVIADGAGSDDDLLFADLNLEDVIVPKVVHDVAGHYNRPELFAPLF